MIVINFNKFFRECNPSEMVEKKKISSKGNSQRTNAVHEKKKKTQKNWNVLN